MTAVCEATGDKFTAYKGSFEWSSINAKGEAYSGQADSYIYSIIQGNHPGAVQTKDATTLSLRFGVPPTHVTVYCCPMEKLSEDHPTPDYTDMIELPCKNGIIELPEVGDYYFNVTAVWNRAYYDGGCDYIFLSRSNQGMTR